MKSFDGLALVVLSSFCFSAGSLLVKSLGPEVPAAWIAFLRNAAPLPFLAFFMLRRKTGFASPRWPSLLLRGIWGVLAFACLAWSLTRIPAANAILLGHASPLYAALWGTLFLGERLGAFAVASLAAAFLGVGLALKPELNFGSLPYFAALASGLLSSFAHVAVKKLTRSEPSLRIVFYAAAAGALAFLPAALLSSHRPSPAQWAVMVLIGLAVTGAQVLLTLGISRAPVSQASAGILFTVVVNIAGAWLFWGEAPDAWSWAGGALIAGGLWGLSQSRSTAAAKDSTREAILS